MPNVVSRVTDTRQGRIIVLDDEAVIRNMLQRYLISHGFEVRAVRNGMQLATTLERHSYDLLILDVMMPDEDGLSICRRLRAEGETLPILMLTARGDPVDCVIGLELGADDYLAKPFLPNELLARVRALLRRRDMLRQQLDATDGAMPGKELPCCALARSGLISDGGFCPAMTTSRSISATVICNCCARSRARQIAR